jgi:hypothetical protein
MINNIVDKVTWRVVAGKKEDASVEVQSSGLTVFAYFLGARTLLHVVVLSEVPVKALQQRAAVTIVSCSATIVHTLTFNANQPFGGSIRHRRYFLRCRWLAMPSQSTNFWSISRLPQLGTSALLP